MRDLLEIFGSMVLFIVAIVGMVIGTVIGCRLTFGKPACENLSKLSGYETNYSISMGCLVKLDGVWVDSSVMTARQQQITIKQR